MKYGLSDSTIFKIIHIFEQFPAIEKAVIYGSRAKGDFKLSSDIDISLKGDAIDLSILSNIIIKIDDLLLPYKFDLSIYNHISNSDLLTHIDNIGKIFYDNNIEKRAARYAKPNGHV